MNAFKTGTTVRVINRNSHYYALQGHIKEMGARNNSAEVQFSTNELAKSQQAFLNDRTVLHFYFEELQAVVYEQFPTA